MALYKLNRRSDDLSDAELIRADRTPLQLERYLEAWLERNPWAVVEEPLLWIGRQTTAGVESGTIFPDLIGVDAEGRLVIVELKKGRTPREVVAQILEYAAWAHGQSEEAIRALAEVYTARRTDGARCSFEQRYCEVFETEEVPPLSRKLRLFIIAEEISDTVARVSRFLRQEHGLDIQCIQATAFQTETGEILLSTTTVVGQEDVLPQGMEERVRWTGEKPVRQVVWEAVQTIARQDPDRIFSPRDVAAEVLKQYPSFNKSTVSCQIMSDCVNHSSRHHYPGGEERYWWVEKGKYQRYDPTKHQT